MGAPPGVSSSAASANDMLTPMMALDITDQSTTTTKTSPTAAMVSKVAESC